MKIFDSLSFLEIPREEYFYETMVMVENIIKHHHNVLTCALWWGSCVTKTINVTSDLDLVFLYPLKNSIKVKFLCQQIQDESLFSNNISVEIMCIPEEVYFGQGNFDLSKLLMIMEYENMSDEIYLFGEKGNFTLEKFGFENDRHSVLSKLKNSYEDYVRHKYERWIRVSGDWNSLSRKEKFHQAGKAISTPAHAMRKFAQAKGFPALDFKSIIDDLQISRDVIEAYNAAENFKIKYLKVVKNSFEDKTYNGINEEVFIDEAMRIFERFILLSVNEL